MEIATALVQSAEIYGKIGLAVAAIFLLFGIDRIDPAAAGAYTFRPLLIPGIVILWPLVLLKWIVATVRRGDNTHAS